MCNPTNRVAAKHRRESVSNTPMRWRTKWEILDTSKVFHGSADETPYSPAFELQLPHSDALWSGLLCDAERGPKENTAGLSAMWTPAHCILGESRSRFEPAVAGAAASLDRQCSANRPRSGVDRDRHQPRQASIAVFLKSDEKRRETSRTCKGWDDVRG